MKIALISFGAEHSQRLPCKNYKLLNGKEVCRYTFDFIKKYFSEYPYYVFTDSKLIEKIAKEYNFNTVWCSKDSRNGEKGTILVQSLIKADCYFNLFFTSPVRNFKNIKFNMDLCVNNNINYAHMASFKNQSKPKITYNMSFWRDEKIKNPEYRTVLLPDYFDFDINTQDDFNAVEKYIKENK
jgi:CMP-N-acetylneuraminic acid synthetase